MQLHVLQLQHFNSVVRRLTEGSLAADDAVSELANVNPDSELGTRLTDLMTQVALLNILDFYIGYERGPNNIKAYFSKKSDKETLEKLVGALECTAPDEENKPYTQVKLYRTELDPEDVDFKWVVELTYVSLDFDVTSELDDIPVAVELNGEIEAGKKQGVEPAERQEVVGEARGDAVPRRFERYYTGDAIVFVRNLGKHKASTLRTKISDMKRGDTFNRYGRVAEVDEVRANPDGKRIDLIYSIVYSGLNMTRGTMRYPGDHEIDKITKIEILDKARSEAV